MRAAATEVGVRSDNPGLVPGMVIGEDRACPKCGYNVRGLAVGKPCPECGRPIFFGLQSHAEHHLADLPNWFISVQSLGLWLLFAGGMGAGALLGAWEALGPASAMAGAVVASVWLAGVVLIALPRPLSRQEQVKVAQEPVWLRGLAVGTQALWALAAGLALAPMPGPLAALPMWLAIVAGFGLLPTMALVARLAEFAGDPDRGSRLNYLVVFTAICVLLWIMGLRLMVPVPPAGGAPLLLLIIVIGALYALWCFYQLAVTGSWAIQIARRDDERVEALRERFARDRAAGAGDADREGFGGPVQTPIGSMMGIKHTKR